MVLASILHYYHHQNIQKNKDIYHNNDNNNNNDNDIDEQFDCRFLQSLELLPSQVKL